MAQLTTPTLSIDLIEIEEGFNVRKEMDQARLERMASSIQRHELVQPISVCKGEGGQVRRRRRPPPFRRCEACREERGTGRLLQGEEPSLIANLHREDLNDIDVAEGLKELAVEQKLKTNREIASEVGFSASWVGDLLRLLKLPVGVQALIAAGHVPVKAERVLRDIAKVSPRIAECVCELAKREKVEPANFVRVVPDLLDLIPRKEFRDKPTMVPTAGARLSSIVVTDEKKLRDLGDRYLAAVPWAHTSNPEIRFNTDEVDAARALRRIDDLEPNKSRVSNHPRLFGSVPEPNKRTTGVEPATSSLGSLRSTN